MAGALGTQRIVGVLVLAFGVGVASLDALAQAQVTLTGSIGSRAILMVNGAPKTLGVGESFQGVKLVSITPDQAVVETAGQRQTLRMNVPTSLGATHTSAGGNRVVLTAGSGGHFVAQGAINDRSVNFMLDTGATSVALSAADAQRIGLDFSRGTPVQMSTANGLAQGWRVKLSSVRLGDVVVYDVDAVVSQMPMPYVLLGNSFISRFSMRREADQMVLEKRF